MAPSYRDVGDALLPLRTRTSTHRHDVFQVFLYALNGISREDTAVYNCGDLRRKNVRLGRSGKHRRNDGGVEHRVEGRIFLKVRNKLFQILIGFSSSFASSDFPSPYTAQGPRSGVGSYPSRDMASDSPGSRSVPLQSWSSRNSRRAAGVSAFCGVGEFKVHISFFAEANGAESLIVDSVITSGRTPPLRQGRRRSGCRFRGVSPPGSFRLRPPPCIVGKVKVIVRP